MTSRRECIDFLAQCLHETLALRFMEEIASGQAYDITVNPSLARQLGNVHPGDGPRYKGRGIIMLTGRANYRSYGQALGLPLEAKPWLASNPAVGWKIAALYWRRRVHAKGTAYPDFVTITRRINGGTNGLDDRLRYRRLLAGQSVRPRASQKSCRFYRRSLEHWSAVARTADRQHPRKRARAMVRRRREQLKLC